MNKLNIIKKNKILTLFVVSFDDISKINKQIK